MPKGYLETVNQRWKDNAMNKREKNKRTKEKRTTGQTMIYKTLHRK
jgi:hypothetical protein